MAIIWFFFYPYAVALEKMPKFNLIHNKYIKAKYLCLNFIALKIYPAFIWYQNFENRGFCYEIMTKYPKLLIRYAVVILPSV